MEDEGIRRVYFQVAFDPIEDVRRAMTLLGAGASLGAPPPSPHGYPSSLSS